MKKTIDRLRQELRTVRTGRASTGLVENLRVDYYGSPTPLGQLASLAVPDATMILIKPFDPSIIKEIEKAIKNSELSLSPIMDGKMIRLSIPPLSEERRKQIASQVKGAGELAKVSLRNIRRDANKQFDDNEKKKLISEDERDKGKKDIDNITKDYAGKIDEVIKTKNVEIMES
jgi:ribosome recycling factor